MLKRLLMLFALVFVAAATASWFSQQAGDVQVEWMGWRGELPTSLAVVLIMIFALALVFFDRILRAIMNTPGWFGGRLRERRAAAGHRALTLGLMAVSAGEPEAARKQASRAERLLDAPKLTGLLVAQAAHMAGDHQAARRYFTSISADRETAFLGQIGLMRLALDGGDADAAHKAATAALTLNPKSWLAARALLELETDRSDWQAALPALAVMQKRHIKALQGSEADAIRRQRVAVYYLTARDQTGEDQSAKVRNLQKALDTDSGFLPAIIALADLYINQKAHGKARKILEAGFKQTPHSDLLPWLKVAWKANDGQFIARLEKLVETVGSLQRARAYKLAADVARIAGLDGEASRLSHEASVLVGDSDEAVMPEVWQCLSCKSLNDDWRSHCPACGEFACLRWQRPERVTPMIPLKAKAY